MKLTVVGCAGSFPGPDSPASCYLVEHDGTKVILDMGNGSLGALFQYVDIYDIDAVVLTHLHIDHCADLGSYYVARKYRLPEPPPKLAVYGPAGTSDRMAQLYGLNQDPGMTTEFDFYSFADSDTIQIGSIQIKATPLLHVIPSFGLRVSAGGRSFMYSGDTGPCPRLVDAARGADLALFEASFLDRPKRPKNMHLTGHEAAQAAVDAGVNRLVLTHLVAWNDPKDVLADAKSVGDLDITLASAGLQIEI